MPNQPSNQSEWVLNQEAFDTLLRWLHSDQEEAGVIYQIIRTRLTKFFECQGCPFPEEFTDTTINRVTRRLSEGVTVLTNEPYSYFYGVARNVLSEYWKGKEKNIESLETLPAKLHPSFDPNEIERRREERLLRDLALRCLTECLETMSEENRNQFLEYHQDAVSDRIQRREEMAERLGIPLNRLRVQMYRLREKLEQFVMECVERKSHPNPKV